MTPAACAVSSVCALTNLKASLLRPPCQSGDALVHGAEVLWNCHCRQRRFPDQRNDPCRVCRDPAALLDLVEFGCKLADGFGTFRLGKQDAVGRGGNDRHEILAPHRGGHRIDPHPAAHEPVFEDILAMSREPFRCIASRQTLELDRNRILEIDNDHVGAAPDAIAEALLAVARDDQPGTIFHTRITRIVSGRRPAAREA
jgi:hypothetical protein